MKIVMVFVSSVDGKTTKDNQAPSHWASPEDQKHFFTLINQSSLIVMGRETYEVSLPGMKLRPDCLRVVLTHQPEMFASQQVEGQLEFSSESPKELVTRLQSLGYQEMLLVGGAQVASAFVNEGLVAELYLTIEPILFGHGRPVIDGLDQVGELKLMMIEQLNASGTLLIKYQFPK